MESFNSIILGDFIRTLTDYHANGSYKILKENIELKRSPDHAIMIRTLNFERPDFENDLIYLNEKEYNYLKKTKVYPNDILMNKIANPGSVYLMPGINMPVSLAMNLFLIRFNREVNQVFMFYLMKTNESYIKKFANGTTTLTITKDAVKGLNFKVPPKSDQDNIAKTLSDLDKKIELNNKINTELEAMAKLIYDYWFVQFDFPDAKGKPYKSSGGKMVYNEALKREIPEGWESGTSADVFKFNPTLSIKKGDICSYIDMNALPTSGFMTKRVKKKPFSGGMKFQNGDVVVARITPCLENGKTGLISLLKEGEIGFGSTEFIVLRSKEFDLRCFGACLSRSDEFRKYAISKMTGTSGRKRVNYTALEEYKMPIPDENLLLNFESRTSPLFKKMTASPKENQELTELRDWLLPMLMNGQVTVKDA